MGPLAATLDEIYAKMLNNSIMNSETDCLLWQGGETNGYCLFKWKGTRYYLHRFVYQNFVGPIKHEIMHTCDNRRCWNLAHLVDAPHKVNIEDMATKGRAARGTFHGRAILTVEQVIEIRNSDLTVQELADWYSVGLSTIKNILSGRNWKHIPW